MMSLPGLFLLATLQYHLPPNLLSSICWVESKHDIKAINIKDGGSPSYGICQIKLNSARMVGFTGSAKQLQQPETNIYYAARYLSHLQSRYRNNNTQMIIAYNRGSAKALTRTSYSDKVFSIWRMQDDRRYAKCNASMGY